MKTTANLKGLIASNRDFLNRNGKNVKKSVVNKTSKEIKLHTELLRYLETEPKEEFIASEIKRLKKVINAKNSAFDNWSEKVCSADVPIKKRRALFNKENEILKHRLQLKNLEFLMN
jgi:hypothetical protein